MKTRKARPGDFTSIRELIENYAGQDLLLPRASEDIRTHLDRFLVLTEAKSDGRRNEERLLGCVSLESYGEDLAEVRSLAVIPEAQGRGAGAKLVDAALAAAKDRGIARVFAVTHAPGLFERRGFERTSRQAVPEKIEQDCRFCTREHNCDLVGVVAVVCPERVMLPILNFPSKVGASL